MEGELLRVHSADLHDHVAQEVGECLESELHADLKVRCKDGDELLAHKLILATSSPYLKTLLEIAEFEDIPTLELPDYPRKIVSLLLEVTYKGIVEATIDDLRELVLLAHNLYVKIPVSEELLEVLELDLPDIPPLSSGGMPRLKQRPSFSPVANGSPTHSNSLIPLSKAISHRVPQGVDPLTMAAIMTKSITRNADHICPICNSKYTNVGSFKQHMKLHDNDQFKDERNALVGELVSACFDPRASMYTCHICDSNYNHSGNFKQHLLKHERESGSISAILVAKSKDGDAFSLAGVIQTGRKEMERPKPPPSIVIREPGTNVHKCEICERTFNNAGNYKQHLTSHARAQANGLPYRSKVQSRNSGNSSILSRPSVAILKCPECTQECANVAELERHISLEHKSMEMSPEAVDYEIEDEGFECNMCDKSFETEAQLNKHRLVHNISSSASGSPDSRSSEVVKHLNRGPSTPSYKCKVCGKKFLEITKLTLHIQSHKSNRDAYRFPCDICGKKFTKNQHVKRHRLIHTGGQTTHRCVKCNSEFPTAQELNFHVRTGCEADNSPDPSELDWSLRSEHDVTGGDDEVGVVSDMDDEMMDYATPSVILSDG